MCVFVYTRKEEEEEKKGKKTVTKQLGILYICTRKSHHTCIQEIHGFLFWDALLKGRFSQCVVKNAMDDGGNNVCGCN